MTDKELLSLSEAAERYKVPVGTLRTAIQARIYLFMILRSTIGIISRHGVLPCA
jgi:hypothetical protein